MPTFLLRRAHLVPLDGRAGGDPAPHDVLVEDGRVVEVGRQLALPRGTKEYDADGRWLMPGLWDQHVHLGQWTLSSQRLDLVGSRSVEEVFSRLQTKMVETPGVPIVGWGHRPAWWEEQPSVLALDQVTGTLPVVLISGDGHHAWMNTAAMRALDLSERDAMIAEGEWFRVYPRLEELVGSEGTAPAAYLQTMRDAAAKGVVGVVDLEFDQTLAAWPARTAAGAELLRVRVGAYADTLAEFLAAGVRTGEPIPGAGPLVTMGPLKIISDGSLNTRTAWCCTPYLDGLSGAPNLSSEGLRGLMAAASHNGLEMAIHAIGDAAVTEALDAYADTGATGSIEHAQLMAHADAARMAALGIRASVQPAHLLDDRDLTEAIWPDRTDRCFALRWLLDAGVEMVLGSDAPVSALDPWEAIAAAVHRSNDDRAPWHPEHSLTLLEALAASTDGLGTVAAGHPADLVLLDADPLVSGSSLEQAKAMRSMTVAGTWVAGRLVHSSL